MKTTNDYITILRKYLSTKADAYGITKIGIFGSVARNEQTEDSDVDVCDGYEVQFILVRFKISCCYDYGNYTSICHSLSVN